MFGPMPKGHWRAAWERDGYGFRSLTRGRRYRVTQAFRDYDGDEHTPGEAWLYLGHNFLPYEDGLSLFVSLDGNQEWQIRMRWTPADQGSIIDAINDYVVPDECD